MKNFHVEKEVRVNGNPNPVNKDIYYIVQRGFEIARDSTIQKSVRILMEVNGHVDPKNPPSFFDPTVLNNVMQVMKDIRQDVVDEINSTEVDYEEVMDEVEYKIKNNKLDSYEFLYQRYGRMYFKIDNNTILKYATDSYAIELNKREASIWEETRDSGIGSLLNEVLAVDKAHKALLMPHLRRVRELGDVSEEDQAIINSLSNIRDLDRGELYKSRNWGKDAEGRFYLVNYGIMYEDSGEEVDDEELKPELD